MPLPLPHTLLLQSLLLEPYLTTEALNKLHGAVCTTYRETIPLASMITQINAQLYKVGMALKVANGNAALVMTVDDEVAKITERPVNETMLFKKILQIIITNEVTPYSTDSTAILNAAHDIRPVIKLSVATACLHQWVKDGWLNDNAGIITVGPRSLMELDKWLVKSYEGYVAPCGECSELVLKGLSCPNAECTKRYHKACGRTALAASRRCPACKTRWDVSSGSSGNSVGPARPVKRQKKKIAIEEEVVEEKEDEDHEDEDDS